MKKSINDWLLLPESTLLDKTSMQLDENRELIITGCKNILEYSLSEIKVSCIDMTVKVLGSKLYICCMDKNSIIIKGFIENIKLSRTDYAHI